MVITVKTPARLHMGQIDLNGSLGRIFGGMGVTIEKPNVELELKPEARLLVSGKQRSMVSTLANQFLEYFGLKTGAFIHVKQTIPEHVGLGSSTQLALAVGYGLAKLNNLDVDIDELAKIMDRGGSRSGVGVGAFKSGGFIIDGGRKLTADGPQHGDPHYLPPAIVRHAIPGNWRFVVAIPDKPQGLSGSAEKEAFRRLPPMAPEKVGEICRNIMMRMLPALVEEDIDAFGQALTAIQQIVGNHFKPVQNGTFANELSARIIKCMRDAGAKGAGQSSWGPAVYGLVPAQEAENLEVKVKEFLEARGKGTVFCTRVLNQGAQCILKTEILTDVEARRGIG